MRTAPALLDARFGRWPLEIVRCSIVSACALALIAAGHALPF